MCPRNGSPTLADPLQRSAAMGNGQRAKKDIKRLQLRREVIRVLASDSLAKVHGGWGTSDTEGGSSGSRSPCMPSK